MEHVNSNNLNLPITNFFIYKDEKYPFNIDLFKKFSPFFSTKQFSISPNESINLIDEANCQVQISKEYIKYFIGYCQNLSIPKEKINNESAETLYYLAKYYQVKSLIDQMNEYFKQNEEEFILHFLSNPELEHLDSQRYETILSSKLLDYINNPQMLLLPLPIIQRVLTKYQLNHQNQENESQLEITEFLFKYLEKYANQLSNSSILNTLHKIESEFVQTKQIVYTQQNETLSKITEEIDQMKSDMKKIRDEMKNKIMNEMNGFKDETSRLTKEVENHIELMKNEMKSDMKNSLDQIKIQIKDNFTDDQNKLKDEIIQSINNVKDELNQFKSETSNNFIIYNRCLNQFKSENSNSFSRSNDDLNQLKSENCNSINISNDDLDQHKSNFNKNFYNNKEENEELMKQIDHLKRLFFDIGSSSYFEKSDNLDTFNSLYGESQAIILEGILSKKSASRDSQCIANVNELLSYLLNEQNKSNKPQKLTTFIQIESSDNKENLLNLSKIDSIVVNYEFIVHHFLLLLK